MAGRLEGKVAIITGASRGLGQYCAVGYAREGAKVAVVARTIEVQDERLPGTIHETAKMVEDAGGEALAVACNVADQGSIEAMVKEVLDKWGRVDILMNNAAIQPPGGNTTITPKHWELQIRVNVHGPFHCARAVIPAMVEAGGGNIINISSGATRGGSPYGGTKRALEAMTEGMAQELKGQGIAVNALKPVGAIATPGYLFAQVPRDGGDPASNLPSPDSYVEASVLLALQTPETFTGRAHNDAEIVALLADDAARERFRSENPDYWVAAMNA